MTPPRRIARRIAAVPAVAACLLAAAVPAVSAAPPWAAPQIPEGSPASAPALTFDNLGVGILTGSNGTGTLGAQNTTNLDAFPRFGPLTGPDFALDDNVATYATTRFVGLGTRLGHPSTARASSSARSAPSSPTCASSGPSTAPGAHTRSTSTTAATPPPHTASAPTAPACTSRCTSSCAAPAAPRAARSALTTAPSASSRPWRSTPAATSSSPGRPTAASTPGFAPPAAPCTARSASATRGSRSTRISAAITADRAAAVAWEAQSISEGVPGSPATVDAALKAAGASHHVHSAQRLTIVPALPTGHYVGERRVRVIQASDGRIQAAWTGYANGRFVVQTGALSGFRFGAAQTVSDPAIDAVLADLDAGPSGELTIAFRTGVAGADPGHGPDGLRAALRAPGAAAFGSAEVIVQDGDTPVEGTLRFDPATGQPVAAWRALRASAIATSAREPLVVPPNGRRF